MDRDPHDTLRLVETESTLWKEAQLKVAQNDIQTSLTQGQEVEPQNTATGTGRWCFTDGSRKDDDSFFRERMV